MPKMIDAQFGPKLYTRTTIDMLTLFRFSTKLVSQLIDHLDLSHDNNS